jgi:hypothetical protein
LQRSIILGSFRLRTQKNSAKSKDRTNKGFEVEAGKDRFQEELLIMGGQFIAKIGGDLLHLTLSLK